MPESALARKPADMSYEEAAALAPGGRHRAAGQPRKGTRPARAARVASLLSHTPRPSFPSAHTPRPIREQLQVHRRVAVRARAREARSTRVIRRLAFDRTLPASEALGRIRDAFRSYDEEGIA